MEKCWRLTSASRKLKSFGDGVKMTMEGAVEASQAYFNVILISFKFSHSSCLVSHKPGGHLTSSRFCPLS